MPEVQAAARVATEAAEYDGPMIFAHGCDAGCQPASARRADYDPPYGPEGEAGR
jgi:hypothetical protein